MKSNILTDTAPALTLQLKPFQRVFLTLVGCGGTGSHIASGLISLAGALVERNIQTDIYLVDPDTVEPKNVGRQLFSPADIGKPKAEVLAYRLNASFGARVGASVRFIDTLDTFTQSGSGSGPDVLNVVIGAVDNPAARSLIAAAVGKSKGQLWWLDCGNENHSGQVALGNIADRKALHGCAALGMIDRLPAPHLVYPDLVKAPKALTNKQKRASCAELAATGEQGLMVNRIVAAYALAMLDALLLRHDLHWFALAFDLAWGGAKSYAIDTPTIAEAVGMKPQDLTPSTSATPNDRRRR